MSTQVQKKQETLDSEQQLLELVKDCPDILVRHPALLAELEVPHETGGAVSLIERQVSVLRERLQLTDKRLRELMDIARSNERLAESRQRLAINLLGARDLDDVISIVLDELRNELGADCTTMRLLTGDQDRLDRKPGLFVDTNTEALRAFATMLDNRKPICGRTTTEQNDFLFGDGAAQVASASVIPLVAGAPLGLLALGSRDENRFTIALGTDFLAQIGELVSAALAVHLET